MDKLTFEEFRVKWYEQCNLNPAIENSIPGLSDYFCECDYKRYTDDWKETL
jgi:hypothetical protein